MLTRVEVDSDEDSEEGESDEDGPEAVSTKGKEKEKPEWSIKPRPDIAKRSNKHACVLSWLQCMNCTDSVCSPIEVTSKRPVTRKRTVVEVKTAVCI